MWSQTLPDGNTSKERVIRLIFVMTSKAPILNTPNCSKVVTGNQAYKWACSLVNKNIRSKWDLSLQQAIGLTQQISVNDG